MLTKKTVIGNIPQLQNTGQGNKNKKGKPV